VQPTKLKGQSFDTRVLFFFLLCTNSIIGLLHALTIQAGSFVVKLDEFGVVLLHSPSSLGTPFLPRPRKLLPVTRRSHYARHV